MSASKLGISPSNRCFCSCWKSHGTSKRVIESGRGFRPSSPEMMATVDRLLRTENIPRVSQRVLSDNHFAKFWVIAPTLPLLQLKLPSQGIVGTCPWTSHWGFMGSHRSIPTSNRPCLTGEQSWNLTHPYLTDGNHGPYGSMIYH